MPPPQVFSARCGITEKASGVDHEGYNPDDCRKKATFAITAAKTVVAVHPPTIAQT